jgi:hypothetical protein
MEETIISFLRDFSKTTTLGNWSADILVQDLTLLIPEGWPRIAQR